jgi:cytochrome c553
MKKTLKWVGIVIGSLLLIAAIVAFVLVSKFNSRLEKKHEIVVEKLTIPSDSASIARGKRWLPLCQSCHGEALQGKLFFDDPTIGTIYSPNLTAGVGGIANKYKDEDWIRSLRHGVNPEGHALFVMPSNDFANYSKEDLTDLIAYLKKIPPVDNPRPANRLPAFTKILMQLGAFGDVLSTEVIDHKAPFPPHLEPAATPAYGKYLVDVIGCKTCHGPEFNGGKSPDPNSPPVPNITSAGNIGKWKAEDFLTTMRMGVTPEKHALNDTFMSWKHLGQFSDRDLTAIYAFLRSVPKKETPKD